MKCRINRKLECRYQIHTGKGSWDYLMSCQGCPVFKKSNQQYLEKTIKESDWMSVNLKEYEQTEFDAVITDVLVMLLREWLKGDRAGHKPLDDKVIDDKFNNPDRDNVVVLGTCGNVDISGFFMVPTAQGYNKSNLRRFVELNHLPLVALPKQKSKWVGKVGKCKIDKNGFLRWMV